MVNKEARNKKGMNWLLEEAKQHLRLTVSVALALIVVVVAVFFIVRCAVHDTNVAVVHNKDIEPTPEQIEQIKDIGQWEFLSVSDEEIVDTVRYGFFGDDELSRIYYGTLRLGIDLSEAGSDWISTSKGKSSDGSAEAADTVVVRLPKVKLLDERFVDEARTRTFYEDGKWSESDKAALTERARRAMLRRCLTQDNLDKAEKNAKEQFSMLMRSLGVKLVKVEVDR